MIKINEKAPRKLGLYIHIPFCRTKCLYCDFCSLVSRDEAQREAYVDALIREIGARGTKDYSVDTVYFGGGTPSILRTEQIERILNAVRESFALCEDVEITLECNPSTVGRDKRTANGRSYEVGDESLEPDVEGAVPYGVGNYFSELRKIGVNRLSIGIQSAVDGELKLIGRRHTFNDAKQTFCAARESGFENISVDLMFGIPSQTLESLRYSLDEFIKLGAEHISIYSLQLEEGTPLYKMQDRYIIPDDDLAADMYEKVVSRMKNVGYVHYEISNFSKEGMESRHNSKYWRLDEYLGLGLAAHSDFGGKRIENTKSMKKYLSGEYIENESGVSLAERELEFLMLGLRTERGISKSEFYERFCVDFDEKYGAKAEKYAKMGYLLEKDDRVFLDERGFEVSNSILSEILDFDY